MRLGLSSWARQLPSSARNEQVNEALDTLLYGCFLLFINSHATCENMCMQMLYITIYMLSATVSVRVRRHERLPFHNVRRFGVNPTSREARPNTGIEKRRKRTRNAQIGEIALAEKQPLPSKRILHVLTSKAGSQRNCLLPRFSGLSH